MLRKRNISKKENLHLGKICKRKEKSKIQIKEWKSERLNIIFHMSYL